MHFVSFRSTTTKPFTQLPMCSTLKCDSKIHWPFQIIRQCVCVCALVFSTPDNVFCGNKLLNTCSANTQQLCALCTRFSLDTSVRRSSDASKSSKVQRNKNLFLYVLGLAHVYIWLIECHSKSNS